MGGRERRRRREFILCPRKKTRPSMTEYLIPRFRNYI